MRFLYTLDADFPERQAANYIEHEEYRIHYLHRSLPTSLQPFGTPKKGIKVSRTLITVGYR